MDAYVSVMAGVQVSKILTFSVIDGVILANIGTTKVATPSEDSFRRIGISYWAQEYGLKVRGIHEAKYGLILGIVIKELNFLDMQVWNSSRIGYFDAFSSAIVECRNKLTAIGVSVVPKLWLSAGMEA